MVLFIYVAITVILPIILLSCIKIICILSNIMNNPDNNKIDFETI